MNTKTHIHRLVHEHGAFAIAVLCGMCFAFFCLWIPNVFTNRVNQPRVVVMKGSQYQSPPEFVAVTLSSQSSEAPASSEASVVSSSEAAQQNPPPIVVILPEASSSAPRAPAVVSKPVVKAPVVTQVTHLAAPEASSESSVSSTEPIVEAPQSSSSATPVVSSSKPSSSSASSAAAVVNVPKATSSASASSSASVAPERNPEPVQQTNGDFPAFVRAVHPFSRVPNWGAMTLAEMRRPVGEFADDEWVAIPAYNMSTLTTPMSTLRHDGEVYPGKESIVTAKLYYSTRYMGKYDLDAAEYSGEHPGLDLKQPLGTGVGAIGGGRVYSVSNSRELGMHVIIEHRNDSGRFFSLYAHLSSAKVGTGDAVRPGQTIGFVGLTGMTSGPHLHLEVHKGTPAAADGLHAAAFSESNVINPMTFISRGGKM